MKLNENYVIKHVLDSDILIDIKSGFDSVIKLNKTSNDICELVIAGFNEKEIIESLYKKYDVDINQLEKDINLFIQEMLDKGIFINE